MSVLVSSPEASPVATHVRPDAGGGRSSGRRARRSRRAHPQPEGCRPHAAAPAARGLHGRQRVGQVVAGLRHDLRRRAAPLRRVAVGLRPAVSRADGEAGRRRHRRHRAGDRHPAEEQHPQSALDRRHDHRDSRLPAAALGAGRPHDLPPVRPRGRARVARTSSPSQLLALARRARGCSSASTIPIVAGTLPADAARDEPRSRTDGEMRRCASGNRLNGQIRARRAAGSPDERSARRRSTRCGGAGSAVLLVGGRAVTLEEALADARVAARTTSVAVIVDRLRVGADVRARLTDSIETAFHEGDGAAFAIEVDDAGRSGHARTGSASGSSAGRAAFRTRCRSRGCSRSTTRSAPARRATGSATSSSST